MCFGFCLETTLGQDFVFGGFATSAWEPAGRQHGSAVQRAAHFGFSTAWHRVRFYGSGEAVREVLAASLLVT